MMLEKDQFAMDSGAWCGLNKPELNEKKADLVLFGIPFDKGGSRDSLFEEVSEFVRDFVQNNIFFTAVGGDHS